MGRPKLFPGEVRHMNLYLSEEQYRYLSKLSHDTRKSASFWMREWIDFHKRVMSPEFQEKLKCVDTSKEITVR